MNKPGETIIQAVCIVLSNDWTNSQAIDRLLIHVQALLRTFDVHVDVVCTLKQSSDLGVSERCELFFDSVIIKDDADPLVYDYYYVLNEQVWNSKTTIKQVNALSKKKAGSTKFFLWTSYFTIPYPIQQPKDLFKSNILKYGSIIHTSSMFQQIKKQKEAIKLKEKTKSNNNSSAARAPSNDIMTKWVAKPEPQKTTPDHQEAVKRLIEEPSTDSDQNKKIKSQSSLTGFGFVTPMVNTKKYIAQKEQAKDDANRQKEINKFLNLLRSGRNSTE